jgi:hypothetical protein
VTRDRSTSIDPVLHEALQHTSVSEETLLTESLAAAELRALRLLAKAGTSQSERRSVPRPAGFYAAVCPDLTAAPGVPPRACDA